MSNLCMRQTPFFFTLIFFVFVSPISFAQEKSTFTKIGIVNGRAINLPKPIYSLEAQDLCAEGRVEIETLIDEQGSVLEAKPILGNELLYESAVEAAKLAKFAPMPETPVKIRGIIVYNFVPERKCFDAGIVNKKAIFIPKPDFPHCYRCAGSVLVQVIIDILEGKVVTAKVLGGHPLLKPAVLKSAQNAVFSPTTINANRQRRAKGILVYKFTSSGKVEY